MPTTKEALQKSLDDAFNQIAAGAYDGAVWIRDREFCSTLAEILTDLHNRIKLLEETTSK
jgi:hypothetical protein